MAVDTTRTNGDMKQTGTLLQEYYNDDTNQRGVPAQFGQLYVAGRPPYPHALYQRVFDFHARHGTRRWTLAHDVGCGPGNVADVLARHAFEAVVASDPVAYSNADGLPGNVSFVTSAVERLPELDGAGAWLGQTDLITAAECLTMMSDYGKVLDAFERLLAPRGTLAVWFYGRPVIAERDGRKDGPAQKAFDDIMSLMFRAFGDLLEGDGRLKAAHVGGVGRMTNWLEDFRLDAGAHRGRWRDVRRVQWNRDRPMCFFRSEDFPGGDVVPYAMSEEQLQSEELETPDGCSYQVCSWDEGRLFEFILALRPHFKKRLEAPENQAVLSEVERLRSELRTCMNGELEVLWPATLILATRTEQPWTS